MSEMGQTRPKRHVRVASDLRPNRDAHRTSRRLRFVSIPDSSSTAKDSGAVRISLIVSVATILSRVNAEPPMEELLTDPIAQLLMTESGLSIAGVRSYTEHARSRPCRKTHPRATGVEAR